MEEIKRSEISEEWAHSETKFIRDGIGFQIDAIEFRKERDTIQRLLIFIFTIAQMWISEASAKIFRDTLRNEFALCYNGSESK